MITQEDLETKKIQEKPGLSLEISVEMPYRIEKIKSLSHPVRIKKSETMAVLQLKHQNIPLEEDFVLQIKIEHSYEPRMWIEVNEKGGYAGMLSFCPNFEYHKEGAEYLFLVDRSSSIGNSIVDVKSILKYFINNLPDNHHSIFNIIDFGTSF